MIGYHQKMSGSTLCRLTGESTEWPTDDVFRSAWQSRHAYQTLLNPKIVHILRRLNDTYLSSKSERISIDSPLAVEHILPQDWLEHWPLPDGSKGLTSQERNDPNAGQSHHSGPTTQFFREEPQLERKEARVDERVTPTYQSAASCYRMLGRNSY